MSWNENLDWIEMAKPLETCWIEVLVERIFVQQFFASTNYSYWINFFYLELNRYDKIQFPYTIKVEKCVLHMVLKSEELGSVEYIFFPFFFFFFGLKLDFK
jgi:hypothetical protein